MAYRCGECSIDHPSKRKVIEHMLKVHKSPYLEGDWRELSDKVAKELNDPDVNKKIVEND